MTKHVTDKCIFLGPTISKQNLNFDPNYNKIKIKINCASNDLTNGKILDKSKHANKDKLGIPNKTVSVIPHVDAKTIPRTEFFCPFTTDIFQNLCVNVNTDEHVLDGL